MRIRQSHDHSRSAGRYARSEEARGNRAGPRLAAAVGFPSLHRLTASWPAFVWPVAILPALFWLAPMTLQPSRSAVTRSAEAAAAEGMRLTSPAIKPNQSIPPRFTCSGADVSPPLRWAGAPAATRAFALVVQDRDAHDFTHWVIWNLPPRLRSLPEGVANGPAAAGGVQGMNSWQTLGYGGPCPPPGAPHHYVFTLYALGRRLPLSAGASKEQVLEAMRGSILARGRMIATFGR